MTDLTTSPGALTAKPASSENARWRLIARNVFPFVVVLGLWEIVARAGIFPPKLFPSLVTVAEAFIRLTMNGILPHHTFDTVLRLLSPFAIAPIIAVLFRILL